MPSYPRLARPQVAPVDLATADPLGPPASPEVLRRRFDKLDGQRISKRKQQQNLTHQLGDLANYLAVAPDVEAALETLSQELFGKLATVIERHLTLALQEVLQQAITLKVERDFKRGAATMRFHILRDGQEEDIMRGQGGSVANVLSVGLRIFALTQLDTKIHRRLLVLDEQDCWLAPDLVPRLVKIIHEAGKALGFQVILISHHATPSFTPYAPQILPLTPTPAGIQVEDAPPRTHHPD
jgi:hypothetical protein